MDEALHATVLMLSPIVPHICQELWAAMGRESDLLNAPWPQLDQAALIRDHIEMVVQVNGKVRGRMDIAVGADRATIEATALAQENVNRFLEAVTVRKIIVVPGKLVNIVAN
jgi:leucyl-tRNA synthetase